METSETKLYGTYSALQVGTRGMQITLPATYCKANNVKPGTPVELYTVEGSNVLILRPKA